jgi:hypothetical protein
MEGYGRRLIPAARPFRQGEGCLLPHASLRRTGFDRLSLRQRGEKTKLAFIVIATFRHSLTRAYARISTIPPRCCDLVEMV